MKTTEEQRSALRSGLDTEEGKRLFGPVLVLVMRAALDDLDEALADLAKERERAEKGAAAMAEGYESQIAALRAELETTKARLAEAEGGPEGGDPPKGSRLWRCERELENARQHARDLVTQNVAQGKDRDALRAELAECRAELEAASADILTVMAGEKAAEARAERLSNELDEASRMYTTAQAGREAAEARADAAHDARELAKGNDALQLSLGDQQRLQEAYSIANSFPAHGLAALLREVHNEAVEKCAETVWHRDEQDRILALRALAETAPKTESRGIPRTNDDGDRRGNVHPKLGTSSPDDAERVAREWWAEHVNGVAADFDEHPETAKALIALIRTRDAQAREAGRVEGWDEAVEACANQCWVSIRFNEDPRLAMPIMPMRLRALKHPDRAKGGG